MLISQTLSSLLVAAAAHPLLQSGAIVAGTFVLEDAATIVAGMAVADGTVAMPVALGALYVGIAAGDAALYGVGRLAARYAWAARWVRPEQVEPIRRWLDRRLVAAVMSTRFLPGLRLPTYTVCGFLGLSFTRFLLAVVVATLIWTTLLFTAAVWFGDVAATSLGVWRWPIGIAAALVIAAIAQFVGRRLAPRLDGRR